MKKIVAILLSFMMGMYATVLYPRIQIEDTNVNLQLNEKTEEYIVTPCADDGPGTVGDGH